MLHKLLYDYCYTVNVPLFTIPLCAVRNPKDGVRRAGESDYCMGWVSRAEGIRQLLLAEEIKAIIDSQHLGLRVQVI